MTRLRPLFLVALLFLPAALLAQASASPLVLPATPVGKAVALFVKALNSGSRTELEKFHTDRGGDAENAGPDLEFAEQSGGIDLLRVLTATDHRIEIEAKTRKTARAVVLLFAVEPTPPHAVADVGVRPLRPAGAGGPRNGPGDAPPPPRPVETVIAEAPAIVDRAIEDGFSGVVMIARDGKVVLERASGLANRGFAVKNRVDTKFNLGSINKTFTKLAVAQLMQAGKLSLDDRLGKILPDFPHAEAAKKVTVAHLLEMKSGLGDFFGPEFNAVSKARIRTLSDYLPFFAKKPLAFEPGAGEAYSNGGYITLGLIIEKLTGQSYYDYVRDHIFKPAGMSDTDAFELDAPTPNLAVGYTRRGVSNIFTLPARGSSAGGGYSTAPDLLKYAEAVMADRLTSAPYTAWYLGGPRPDAAPSTSAPQGGSLGVAGGSPGVNAVFTLNRAQRLVLIVLTNDDGPAAEELAQKIRQGR